jgi:hypothetical protein
MATRRPIWAEPFLEALRQLPVTVHACKAVGINRVTAHKYRHEDPEFAKAWADALEEGIDRAEQEAFRRAVVGFEEPVIHQGKPSYVYRREVDEDGNERFVPVIGEDGQPVLLTVRKHSDSLLQFVLKGRRKQVYADRTELVSPDGSMSPAVDETTKAARVARLLDLAHARRAAREEDQDFSDLA